MRKIVFSLILFIIPFSVFGLSEDYVDRLGSITVNYFYDDYSFDNVDVSLYYVVELTHDNNYLVSSKFSGYSLNIQEITILEDLKEINDKINFYIEENNIIEDDKALIKDNKVTFINLLPGIYFVKTKNLVNGSERFKFENVLLSIPNFNSAGVVNYDVVINSKVERSVNNVLNPITYDDIKIYFCMFVLSIVSFLCCLILIKKRKIRKNSCFL